MRLMRRWLWTIRRSAYRYEDDTGHPVDTRTSLLLALGGGLLLAVILIFAVERIIRPTVEVLARTQTINIVSKVVDHAILSDFSDRGVNYDDFVAVERDAQGSITALTTDMAAMNFLRVTIVAEVLEAVESVDVSHIEIPLGNIMNVELLWARGPSISARALVAGTVSAEFQSEFSATGINQTVHRIYLDVQVPLTVMLAGSAVESVYTTQICVAETVIIGTVPDSYLQLQPNGGIL